MLDINIAYPEFVPNQILTDGQLNQLRTHLEQEDRITRIRLSGMGIVCGLNGRKVSAPAFAVEIDAGFGVTSDGDLIELCAKTTYTHSRPYVDPDKDEESKLKYLPWRTAANPATQVDIIELIQKEAMEAADPLLRPQGAVALTSAALDPTNSASKVKDRVLVLYLEHLPVELKSCLVTSCDNKGRNINVNVRALLVKKSDLIAQGGCSVVPVVQRVPRPQRAAFNAVSDVAAVFTTIVTGNVTPVGTNIKNLFDAHAVFLNLPLGLTAVGPNALAGKLTTGSEQYRYDALLDFAAAYNEAAAGAYALVKECCPDGAFPRHLMLGVLDSSSDTGFRSEFSASPLRNVMHGEIDRVRGLFRRLHEMVENLNLGALPAAVSIYPSHTAAYPLGRRARPFYFPAANLAPLWRPHARCTVDCDWPWDSPVASGLATDYSENTLLRIEGHAGLAWPQAYDAVIAARHAGNAEFDVLCSYLDDGGAAEKQARTDLARQLGRLESDALQEASDEFEGWLADTKASTDAIVKLARDREEQLHAVVEISRSWIAMRERRRLQCDTDALAHDYLQARSQLLCAIGRARAVIPRVAADIERLADDELIGPGLKAMVDGAEFTLRHHLVDAVLASPQDWDADGKVTAQLESIPGIDGTTAVRLALNQALSNLDANIRRMADETVFSRRLEEFDFDLCAFFFRTVIAESREFWHWTRALGLRIPGATLKPGDHRDAPLHRTEEATMAADWLGLQGCALARFAAIFAEYEAIRAADLSLFRNLAAVDGLEHLAGVSKGGTFVMVCDRTTTDGRVLADFSLEGGLPCCCNFDATGFCLPPLALPDVRVITLPPAKEDLKGPIIVRINVIDNDCDLAGRPPQLKIAALSEKSELGVSLEVEPEGLITYRVPGSVRPGMVDRFEYQLVSGRRECDERTATGSVIVIFAIDPVLDGGIKGVVLTENDPVNGASVKIQETGATATTTGGGRFTFPGMPAGDYTLVAAAGGLTSDPVTVTVQAGETTDVELHLNKAGSVPPPRGNLVVRTIDPSGAVLPGVMVTVTNSIDTNRGGSTDGQGIAQFQGLPAGPSVGVYGITAQIIGAVTAHASSQQLAGGQTLVVTLTLATGKATVPSVTVGYVSTTGNIAPLEAKNLVRSEVDARYGKYVETFNGATGDPIVLNSDARATAADFLGKQLTDSTATDASLADSYKTTAAALAAAAGQATGETKASYQQALTVVTAAYLDRVALSNPKSLSSDRTAEIKGAVKSLKSAGVDVADVQSMWGGSALGTTGIGSAAAIGGLLK